MNCQTAVRRIVFVIAFCIGLTAWAGLKAQTQGNARELRAGIARIDITPDLPVSLPGYDEKRGLSKGIHDRLFVRALVFENGGKRLVLISTDLIGFYYEAFESFQKSLLTEFNLKPEELFLCAIHAHSSPGPNLNKSRGHPNDLTYTETLRPKLIEVVRNAFKNVGPVRMGVGLGSSMVGANRRVLKPDGSTRLGTGSLRRNPYGVTDKDVLVLKLARPDGASIGALFDFACHATALGERNLQVSGDILGIAEQFVEKILGGGVVAPVFVGASGDVNPWYKELPSFNTEPGWMPEPELMGTLLGEEVVHVYREIGALQPGGDIKTSFAAIKVPGQKRREETTVQDRTINLTAARVGDVAFLGASVEMLTEVGFAIKAGSPFKRTFLITHCNGGSGYLPPEHLYREGGYEIWSTPFAPQAADIVVKQALGMLYKLQSEP